MMEKKISNLENEKSQSNEFVTIDFDQFGTVVRDGRTLLMVNFHLVEQMKTFVKHRGVVPSGLDRLLKALTNDVPALRQKKILIDGNDFRSLVVPE